MDENMSVGLREQIIAELTTELIGEPTFKAEILEIKVNNAYREVKMKRNYKATSYTEKQIEEDMQNYYSVILNLARYDYNQIGIEGQTDHLENGTSRKYVDRRKMFDGVFPFVKII